MVLSVVGRKTAYKRGPPRGPRPYPQTCKHAALHGKEHFPGVMKLWILRWDIILACHHEGPHEKEAGGQSLRDIGVL